MAKEEKSEKISNDSYLYMHPGENPAIALVSPVLDSNNYHSWSRSVLTALSTKNKLQFVNGAATEPNSDSPLRDAWMRCNNMVVSWLVHSVSPQIRQSILWMENAEAIWSDLKSRFFQGDLLRISDLQSEATQLKQGDQTVREYVTKLRIIWDELESFRPDPMCSCKKVSELIAQRKLEDYAMQFLRGLND